MTGKISLKSILIYAITLTLAISIGALAFVYESFGLILYIFVGLILFSAMIFLPGFFIWKYTDISQLSKKEARKASVVIFAILVAIIALVCIIMINIRPNIVNAFIKPQYISSISELSDCADANKNVVKISAENIYKTGYYSTSTLTYNDAYIAVKDAYEYYVINLQDGFLLFKSKNKNITHINNSVSMHMSKINNSSSKMEIKNGEINFVYTNVDEGAHSKIQSMFEFHQSIFPKIIITDDSSVLFEHRLSIFIGIFIIFLSTSFSVFLLVRCKKSKIFSFAKDSIPHFVNSSPKPVRKRNVKIVTVKPAKQKYLDEKSKIISKLDLLANLINMNNSAVEKLKDANIAANNADDNDMKIINENISNHDNGLMASVCTRIKNSVQSTNKRNALKKHDREIVDLLNKITLWNAIIGKYI